MDLPHKTYPDQVLKETTAPEDEKFSVSTLGLWSLRTAYDQGAFKVRTSDMEKCMDEGHMNTPLSSHVETTYLFSQDEHLRERYSRSSDKRIRYGKIIEELDAMAGDCSYKYLLENLNAENFDPETRDYFLVTVSVDRIDFMDKLEGHKDMRLSGYMLMAKGSTLMVKIDVLQRDNDESEWEQKGDALILFVARNKKTGKSYQVPEMQVSSHDDLSLTQRCFQLGLTIKDWSRDKGMRDMHKIIPTYSESNHYHDYLHKVEKMRLTNPEKVVRMKDTE